MNVQRVAILLDTSGTSGRLMLRGIGAYARSRRQWNCQFQTPAADNVERLIAWQPDGVIIELADPRWIPALQGADVRVVDVAESLQEHPFPLVTHDNLLIGEAAARDLLGRGFRSLAFIGIEGEMYAIRRGEGFARCAAASGATFRSHVVGRRDWRIEDEALRRFIRALPDEPVGVFASNDGRAIQFIEAGRELGLDVPGRVAVVGCDNDDLLCELARPPLSSVVPASERVGFEAAAVLDRLMSGGKRAVKPTRLPPVNVIARQSSEVMAVDDAELAIALKFIRENAHRPFRGDEVVRQVAIARRSLERRFVAHLGHTLHDEIERAHLDQARQLLAHTDLAMPAVADRSGFGSLRTLAIVFRRATGQTPSMYRRRHRMR